MGGRQRRASVIVLAIAILALLFIIGSTLLIMSSHQRQAAEQSIKARELRAVDEALTRMAMQQLRHDAVGEDGIPYNSRP